MGITRRGWGAWGGNREHGEGTQSTGRGQQSEGRAYSSPLAPGPTASPQGLPGLCSLHSSPHPSLPTPYSPMSIPD